MKLNSIVSETEVYDHWSKAYPLEPFVTDPSSHRAELIDPLRWELRGTWYLATIEEKDLEKLNIISSHDWEHQMKLCKMNDYKVSTASKNLYCKKDNIDSESSKRLKKIHDMIASLERGKHFDAKLILVGTSLDGPFTVCMTKCRKLIKFGDHQK